ncbi:hypothetical protein BBJ28_00005736 [Nothophytophthora sp. Chile5]|nr:hypothetical protein BBJ28_00005736 [Nothophytophthora sp. Chile5]
MKLDKAAIRAWCSRDFLVLVLLHLALFATGVTTLYYRHALAASGWARVVRGEYDGDADSLLVGMDVVGGAAVAVAAMGAIAAVLRRKRLLAGIGACLLLLLGGMVFLAVTVLRVNSRAADWARVASASDDSTSKEAVIAVQFDELYCDAQAAYFCDHATLRELLAFGLGNLTSAVAVIVVETNASSSSNTTEPATDAAAAAAMCAQYANNSADSTEWRQLCAFCAASDTSYDDVDVISRWSEDHCVYNSQSISWCSQERQDLINGSSNSSMWGDDEAPYARCRHELLETAEHWSQAFGIGWSVASAVLVALIVCVMLLLRAEINADAFDFDDVENDNENNNDADAYTYSKA